MLLPPLNFLYQSESLTNACFYFLKILLLTSHFLCSWEYYSMIYVRSNNSIRLFPRASLALFLLYHFYLFSSPAGFHLLALLVLFLFLTSLMVSTDTYCTCLCLVLLFNCMYSMYVRESISLLCTVRTCFICACIHVHTYVSAFLLPLLNLFCP